MSTVTDPALRVALVYPGDYAARRSATPDNNRFAPLFAALTAAGVTAEPAVYHPDFSEEVYQQLLQVDAVLVWVNPIQDGHDRTVLDAMLSKVTEAGVFVSTHPDIILKMGTKEVLYQTRHMSWGSDIHLYHSMTDLRRELPPRLARGEVRVLKQNRGHSGFGVWKVEAVAPDHTETLLPDAPVRVRHAARGSVEQIMLLEEFLQLCEAYFEGGSKVIDQAYQPRLRDGMIRCYLVHNRVEGFGHQAVNALYPAPEGADPAEAPQPGPRLYYPPDLPEFQRLKHKVEQVWVPELQQVLEIATDKLPVLWDADFILGPADDSGDTYVLCEINVSSVAPYPDSATPAIVQAVIPHARAARQRNAP